MNDQDPLRDSPFPDDRPPRNALEESLFAIGNDDQRKLQFFTDLMDARVTVLANQPWNPELAPPEDMELLFVSDGENHEQPMLAMFTHPARTARYKGVGGFEHTVELDARQAFLGVDDGCGAFINPNWRHNMRVDPVVAQELKRTVQDWIKRVNEEQTPDQSWPMGE